MRRAIQEARVAPPASRRIEWILVDYKSDKVDGRLDELVEHYRPQVKMYAKY